VSVRWNSAETHCHSCEVRPKVSELPKSDLSSTETQVIQTALQYVIQELTEPFTTTLLGHMICFTITMSMYFDI
jgi:hypothetical protein